MTNGLKFVLWLVLWQLEALHEDAEWRQTGSGGLEEVVGEEQLPWPWVYLLQSVVSFPLEARKDHLFS